MTLSLGIWERLPIGTKKSITRLLRPARFGSLRHTSPISQKWGKDRGTPVDRYYIQQFLSKNRNSIRGRVLEVGGRTYTDRFNTTVDQCDVLDNSSSNPNATIIADLEKPLAIPDNSYDCLVLTQVLQFIFNLHLCIQELHRILRPGGVLLATVPCVSRIDPSYGMEKDYWRFTSSACQRLYDEAFGEGQVMVETYGNVLSCVAFLEGIASEELSQRELDVIDPIFVALIGVIANKC